MQFNAKFTTRKISSADDFAIGCHFHFDNYINKVQGVFDAGRRRLQLKATYRNLSVGLKACLLRLCQNVTIIHGFKCVCVTFYSFLTRSASIKSFRKTPDVIFHLITNIRVCQWAQAQVRICRSRHESGDGGSVLA